MFPNWQPPEYVPPPEEGIVGEGAGGGEGGAGEANAQPDGAGDQLGGAAPDGSALADATSQSVDNAGAPDCDVADTASSDGNTSSSDGDPDHDDNYDDTGA